MPDPAARGKLRKRTVRFTSQDGWRLTATIFEQEDGRWKLFSIGKQHHEHRPLDFAPFHILDVILGPSKPEPFATEADAVNFVRAL